MLLQAAFNKKNTGVMEVLKSTVAEIFSTYPCSLLCCVLFETAQESNKDQYYLHFDSKAKYTYELSNSSSELKYARIIIIIIIDCF